MRVVPMPGQVWGLATAGGPVFLTSYAGKDLDTTVVTAVDRDGALMWHRELDGHPRRPRVSAEGTLWHAGAASVTEVGADGTVLRTIGLDHEEHEYLGAFVVLPDGFCVSWLPRRPSRVVPSTVRARVARHDLTGAARWSTPVAVPVTRSPRVITVSYWSPLLVSGDRVLATFTDGGSGLAGTCLLDLAAGGVVAELPPGRREWHAITGRGEFLVSGTGFARVDATGTVTREWPEFVVPVVGEHDIRGPEFEGRVGIPSHFRVLGGQTGPDIPGYYTTSPALDRDGTTIFWRSGALHTVDADLHHRVLFTQPDDRNVLSRILLLDEGRVLFTRHDDLIVADTGLAPLAETPWPCGDGNPRGNPVMVD